MANSKNGASAYTIKRSLCFLVARSQRLMNQHLEPVLQAAGLTVQQYVALRLVLEGGAKVPSDIAKVLGLDTGGATRLVDQLEEKGLLVRKREAGDRRLVTLALTPDGVDRAKGGEIATTECLDELLTAIPTGGREDFLDNLERLIGRLEAGST
jgi:DNA-binding MarR family transcriptional regulator